MEVRVFYKIHVQTPSIPKTLGFMSLSLPLPHNIVHTTPLKWGPIKLRYSHSSPSPPSSIHVYFLCKAFLTCWYFLKKYSYVYFQPVVTWCHIITRIIEMYWTFNGCYILQFEWLRKF